LVLLRWGKKNERFGKRTGKEKMLIKWVQDKSGKGVSNDYLTVTDMYYDSLFS